mmetsp:Transcript_13931/g.38011  ORF Transcript_13931/g.38011 Transcript_13931/m.38011 type:complete len:219 (-) Transcript_13931:814-1470(-)
MKLRRTILFSTSRPSAMGTMQALKISLSSNFCGGLPSLRRLKIRRPRVPNWSLMSCDLTDMSIIFLPSCHWMDHSGASESNWPLPPPRPAFFMPPLPAISSSLLSSTEGWETPAIGFPAVTKRFFTSPPSTDKESRTWRRRSRSRCGSLPSLVAPISRILCSMSPNRMYGALGWFPLGEGVTAHNIALITCAVRAPTRDSTSRARRFLQRSKLSTGRQ